MVPVVGSFVQLGSKCDDDEESEKVWDVNKLNLDVISTGIVESPCYGDSPESLGMKEGLEFGCQAGEESEWGRAISGKFVKEKIDVELVVLAERWPNFIWFLQSYE